MPDCDNHPRLLAYPPCILTEINEISTTATDESGAPEWHPDNTPYGKNNIVKIDNKLYMSLEDANSDRPIEDPFGGDFEPAPDINPSFVTAHSATVKRITPFNTTHDVSVTSWAATKGDLLTGRPDVINGKASLYKIKATGLITIIDIPTAYETGDRPKLTFIGTLEDIASSALKVTDAYIKYDPTLAHLEDELSWDDAQQCIYKAQYDLIVDAGRAYPLKQFFYPYNPSPKWVYITDINPIRLYNPNPTQQTVGESPLVIEWILDKPFTAINIFKIIGETVRIEIYTTDDPPVLLHDETYMLDDVPVDYLHWLFDNGGLLDFLLIRDLDWGENTTVKMTIEGAEDGDQVGVGGFYPSSPLSLGFMDYAPVVGVINTIRTAKDQYFEGEYNTLKGKATDTLNYKTRTIALELDDIVRNLKLITKISAEFGYPTFFEGTDRYDSLRILGYMPTYNQSLDNEHFTSASLNIRGAL